MATVNYDAKTGKKLSAGQKTTDAKGNTYTQGQTFSPTKTSSGGGSSSGSNDIVKYDAKTGQLLAKGATTTDAMGNTFTQGASFSKTPKIYAGDLGNAEPMKLPTKTFPSDLTGTLAGASQTQINPKFGLTSDENGIITVKQPKTQEISGAATGLDRLKEQLGLMPKATNVSKEIQNSQAQKQFEAAQASVQNYANQINQIVTKSQAAQLSTIGQGRGIPEAIIGGQQAQIAREAAIQALPIQALLANAQGNLEIAQQHLESWSNILREEAKNDYEYKTNVFNLVKQYSDREEQREFDQMQKQETRAYNEQRELINKRSELMSMALTQDAPETVYNAIRNAQSIDEAIVAAGKYGTDILERQIKQAQLATEGLQQQKLRNDINGGGSSAPKVTSVNGVDSVWDGTKYVPAPIGGSGGGDLNTTTVVKGANDIKRIEALVNNKVGLSSSAGRIRAAGPGQVLTANAWRGELDNILAGLTVTELARIKGTGVTFGALSDGERELVAQAANAINPNRKYDIVDGVKVYTGKIALKESEVKKQLNIIKDYAILDFEKRTGMSYEDYTAQQTEEGYLNVLDTALQASNDPYSIYFNQ